MAGKKNSSSILNSNFFEKDNEKQCEREHKQWNGIKMVQNLSMFVSATWMDIAGKHFC